MQKQRERPVLQDILMARAVLRHLATNHPSRSRDPDLRTLRMSVRELQRCDPDTASWLEDRLKDHELAKLRALLAASER